MKIRLVGTILVVLLVCQYILGILTNLYVKFPDTLTNYQQWDFAKGQTLVMSHVALGMLLLISSVVLLVGAIKTNNRIWIIASSIGLASILLAIISGSEFVSTQKEIFSFSMSIFFVSSLCSYIWGLYKTK